MARFYLHLHNGSGVVADEEGMELPSLGAAVQAAVEAIRDVIREEAKNGRIDLRGRIEIVDHAGDKCAVVPFSDAVELKLGPDGQ